MARPKRPDQDPAPTQSIRMLPDDWTALDQTAKTLGFRGRAELLRAIAQGRAAVTLALPEAVTAGESCPG